MGESARYSVVFTGKLIDGYEFEDVKQSFSELFKLSPEKAESVLGCRRTLKKELSHDKAQVYKDKLESIGMETTLDRIEAQTGEFAGLSLVPIEPTDEIPHEAPASTMAGLALEPIDKPAGEEPTVASNDEQAAPEKYVAGDYRRAAEANTEHDEDEEGKGNAVDAPLDFKLIAMLAAVALLGAFVWKVIALGSGYEFSLVAWGIGGAVGYTAKKKGAHGDSYGMICGALVLCAILLGKYWLVGDLLQQQMESLANLSQMDEYALIIEEQKELASYYIDTVDSEEAMLDFMYENGYTDAFSAADIPEEEVAYFKSVVIPMFENINSGDFDFNTWLQSALQLNVDNLSKWDIVTESLGFMDILFFFLGIGTAFQLASGRS